MYEENVRRQRCEIKCSTCCKACLFSLPPMAFDSKLHLWLTIFHPPKLTEHPPQPVQILYISEYPFTIKGQAGFCIQRPCDSTFSPLNQRMLTVSRLYLKLDMTCSCSQSLEQPAALYLFSSCPFTATFTKVWKNWQGSYFQTINCSPLCTCCLVGLVIEVSFLFCSLLIGTQSLRLLCKSVWKSCAPEEATSTSAALCWPNSVKS